MISYNNRFFNLLTPNANRKKVSSYDLITDAVSKQLSKTSIIHITNFFNSFFRLNHIQSLRKIVEIIMIPKSDQILPEAKCCRPIFMLANFEKRETRINQRKEIHDYHHSTIDQVHRTFLRRSRCSSSVLIDYSL